MRSAEMSKPADVNGANDVKQIVVNTTLRAASSEGDDGNPELLDEDTTREMWESADESAVDFGVRILRDHGVIEASNFPYRPGAWFEAEPYTHPHHATVERVTLHLEGFTDAEQQEIASLVLSPARLG